MTYPPSSDIIKGMFELVETTTKDGLYLHGLLKKGEKSKYAVLYIHGFEEDFYSSNYIPVIADALKDNSHTFLSVETRGSGSETEIRTTDEASRMLGSHFEILKEAYMDIDAWIEFLVEKGYHNIILLGHSLGCSKIVRYFAEGSHTKYVQKLVLMAPVDFHALTEVVTDGKYKDFIHVAKQKRQQGKGIELVPNAYSDLRISYQTFESILTLDHFGKMFNYADKDNNFMLLNKIDVPVKALAGSKDHYVNPMNPNHPEEAMDILKLNINNFEYNIFKRCGSFV